MHLKVNRADFSLLAIMFPIVQRMSGRMYIIELIDDHSLDVRHDGISTTAVVNTVSNVPAAEAYRTIEKDCDSVIGLQSHLSLSDVLFKNRLPFDCLVVPEEQKLFLQDWNTAILVHWLERFTNCGIQFNYPLVTPQFKNAMKLAEVEKAYFEAFKYGSEQRYEDIGTDLYLRSLTTGLLQLSPRISALNIPSQLMLDVLVKLSAHELHLKVRAQQ